MGLINFSLKNRFAVLAGAIACERLEHAAFSTHGAFTGPLYDALKSRAETVLANGDVPALKAVLPPPIAVQGEAPGSGLCALQSPVEQCVKFTAVGFAGAVV